jgi:hypothetical protein
MATKSYIFKWAYKSGGPKNDPLDFKKGQRVELEPDLAEWINNDSPGVLRAAPKKAEPKKAETAK